MRFADGTDLTVLYTQCLLEIEYLIRDKLKTSDSFKIEWDIDKYPDVFIFPILKRIRSGGLNAEPVWGWDETTNWNYIEVSRK